MKTFISHLSLSDQAMLKPILEQDGPQAAFDRYASCLPVLSEAPYKYANQWGGNCPLEEPLIQLRKFLSSSKAELSGEYWVDKIENYFNPLAVDAFGADIETQPIEYALYACELAFTLGIAIPCWKPSDNLIRQARKAATEITEYCFDPAGMPRVEILPYFRLIVASWTRLRILEKKTQVILFPNREVQLYEWLVRNLILLTNVDGTQRFGQENQLTNPKATEELFKAALSFDEDKDDSNQALAALPWIPKSKSQEVKSVVMTEPSRLSEWSKVAILQNGWFWHAPNVSICYQNDILKLLAAIDGKKLTDAVWNTTVTVDGKAVKPDGEWQNVCWSCEDDCVYLEMELPLENDTSLGRTVCLMHEDNLLLLADMIKFAEKSDKPRKIKCQSIIPLNGDFDFVPAEQSNEGFLSCDKNRYTVFPLALDEWRTEKSTAKLSVENRNLVYSTQISGNGLFAPLVIDLNPKRSKQPFTWQPLTVTETGGKVISPDKAVGYRLQIGDKQWMFYQSIDKPASRSLLSCQLVYQTMFSRFDQGEFEQIVAIE